MTNLRFILVLAAVALGASLGSAFGPAPARAFVPCLYIPIFGADDPHSTCLTRDQMKRRAVVLQCAKASGKQPEGSRNAELAYIVIGDRETIGALAVLLPEKPRYTCIWERSRE